MILTMEKSTGYELLDTGGFEKLERFGEVVLRRPDPEALWPTYTTEDWKNADAYFERQGEKGKWIKNPRYEERNTSSEWVADIDGLRFNLSLGPFKHVGVFPEQSPNWKWMEQIVKSRKSIKSEIQKEEKIKVLNLFGYTGGATVALARAGAEVTHVDALESNLDITRKNLELNELADAPVRLIADDARKFVEREIKRGAKYDAVVMDPPVYGKAGKNVWRIEEDLLPLLERLKALLPSPLFVLLSGYASEYSHLAYANALQSIFPNLSVESGELAIKDSHGRLLPAGIFARATL